MSSRPALPTAEEIGALAPIGRIAKDTPYSADFLRQLARSGKLRAYKLHRDWLTTPVAVHDYLKSQTKRHEKALSLLQAAEKAFLALCLLLIVFSATPKAHAQSLSNPPPSATSAILHHLTAGWQDFGGFFPAVFGVTKSALAEQDHQLHTALLSFGQALLGKTTEEYLADAPAPRIALAKHPIHPRGLTISAVAEVAPQVLGVTTSQPSPAPTNNAATSATLQTQIQTLIAQTFRTLVAQGSLTGPQGPQGPAGTNSSGITQNGNGQTTALIGGNPIVSYVPSNPTNDFTGASIAGFTDLSSGNLATQTASIQGALTVQGSTSIAGGASIGGSLSAGTSTLSSLTVSGPVNLTGSTTIAGLTVTGFNPGFTQGSVAFQGAAGMSQDNANFFYDSTNHRLGLGTSSPIATLAIQGTGSTNPFTIASSTGAALLTILPSGNVGIGTLSPAAPLHVAGKSSSSVVGSAGTTLTDTAAGPSMAARGNYIYSLKSQGSINILVITDISNPASPAIVSTSSLLSINGCGGNIDIEGPYAYALTTCGVGFDGGYVNTFDISNPASPHFLGIGNGLNYSVGFAVQGKYVYGLNPALIIQDISNPSSISTVYSNSLTALEISGNADGAALSGRYLYIVTAGSPNFYVLDVGNTLSPIKVGSLQLSDNFPSGGVNGDRALITVSGRYAYVVGHSSINIVDISNAASPSFAAAITPPASGLPQAVRVSGRYAYVAQTNGVAAYDVSNASAPSYLGLLTTTPTQDLVISGRYAVTSEGQVLDLGGAYIQQLEAGGIITDTLDVKQTADFQNNIEAFGGLNIGSPGLVSSGPVGIYSEGAAVNVLSVTASSTVKNVSFSTASFTNLASSSTASIVKSGLQIISTGTWSGTGASNIGLYVSSVTGGANNYDAIFNGGGNVGIGTTSPQYLLQVGNSSVSGIVARFQNANGACDVNPTTNTLACSSDERLKKNIAPMGDDLSLVMALQPVYFNWNAEASGTLEHPGFIAQQVQQVMPEVVSTDPNTGLLSIGYSDLVPAVVSAMQQMQAEITTLQGGLNGNATATNLSVYSPSNFSGDSVGEAEIPAGQTSVRVSFSQQYAYQPVVTFSPEDVFVPAYIAEKDASGFSLEIEAATTTAITFDWHSFASPSEQLTVADGSTSTIPLMLPPAPQSTPVVIALPVAPDPRATTSTLTSSSSASITTDSSASTTPDADSVSSTPAILGDSTNTPSVAPDTASPPAQPDPTPAQPDTTPIPTATPTPVTPTPTPRPMTSQSSSPTPAPSPTPNDAPTPASDY